MTRDKFLEALGVSPDNPFARAAAPALRLRGSTSSELGTSRIGGLPDLPIGVAWPRWDARAYFQHELEEAQASLARVHDERARAFWRGRVERFAPAAEAAPRPLSFLAQLGCADLAGSGLPLPAGLLSFFYDLQERPWGYDPLHRGAWLVLFTPPDQALVRRERPDDLDPELSVPSKPLAARPTWTFPLVLNHDGADLWRWDDPEMEAAFERLDSIDPEPWHQVGGHPDQIQGDMQRSCALVTQGVYLGRPPDIPTAQLDRMAASDPNWRLLFQFASDDDISWMWGDLGKVYFWMREQDIVAGAWDNAWLQLQSG